ncbi:YihY/virulence factor BrkB family protein [Streptomyces sp. PSAA01]|uniref:YihY/virulence factor BrkB family protein n=1 Tax=Streptomyces sp. PSAA01 TaxID=2912762 RepID=UPI001F2C4D31|nr:YihY/virulence factor BrkB family protein [Streptomyces sp. PSAA01]MCG0283890.1 YihY/virulence factor BrkB family protein [Streptomyces sp. PSAA01]
MQPAEETSKPSGRLRKARALYRNVSKRRMAWLLLKDTVDSCMEYRVTGLAAEAAFFTLLSLPPLLLALIGLLGYFDAWTSTDTVATIRQNILDASATVLSDRGVKEIARPLLDDVIKGGRPDVISLGFAIALWSGSRAVNVFVDTITIMYGLEGKRGIVRTRLLSFLLYLVALVIGAVALPLMVIGPEAVVDLLPSSGDLVPVLYWPVVIVLSIAFLTTLYHVSVPVRSPWQEDIPGALVALAIWVLGSFLLRIYLVHTVEGPTIYGSLAAPVAVLLWIGVSAFAVLVGAAVNAAIDRVWPSVATAAGRAERAARAREEAARLRAKDQRTADDGAAEITPPSEFPERWAQFLPHADIRSRLHTKREAAEKAAGKPSGKSSEKPAGKSSEASAGKPAGQPSEPPGKASGEPRTPRQGPRRPDVRSAADGAGGATDSAATEDTGAKDRAAMDDTAADDDHPVR